MSNKTTPPALAGLVEREVMPLATELRAAAPVLHRALRHGAGLIAAGETDADRVRSEMAAIVEAEPLGQLDYVEVADSSTLHPQTVCGPDSRLLGAVRFGKARLIDNVGVGIVAGSGAAPAGAGPEEPTHA